MKVTFLVAMGFLFSFIECRSQNSVVNTALPSFNPQGLTIAAPGTNFYTQGSSDAARLIYEQDAREYELQKRKELAALREAYKDLGIEKKPIPINSGVSKINYRHTPNNAYGRVHFEKALTEITDMIEGRAPYNLKRAVFLTEHAYDTTLNFKQFERQISKLVEIIQLKMKQDHISTSDNTGKIMTAFQFMADTITVKNSVLEKTITTYPKVYDFEDFYGMRDYHKMFVSKLVRTGKGQCHSLPLLFLILCQEINAKAYLSFAPEHSYVKFKDDNGAFHNIELTNQMLSTDQFILQSGFIKSSAIKSGIYMDTLAIDRVIISTINDLSNSYVRKYGYDDFVLKCSLLVTNKDSHSISGYMHVSNYYNSLFIKIKRQYELLGYGNREFQNDIEFKRIAGLARHWSKYVDNLGFATMPPDLYSLWLGSLKDESMRQQFIEKKNVLNHIMEH